MKVFNKALSVGFNLAILFVILLAYGSINNRWYRVVTVEGNSMAPTLLYGDLMIVTPPPPDIPVDSIVVMNVDGSLVTHRLLGYDAENRPITKGDANTELDNFSNPNLQIVGVYRLRLPTLGYPLLFLSNLLDRA